MAQVIISQLPPPPNVTGSGSSKGTDLFPATDVTATTGPNAGSGGTTNKYTLSEIYNWILESQGLKTYAATRVATTLALTATYSNGILGVGATLTNSGAQAALEIDGVVLSIGDRVLVKNQVSPAQNGIYVVTVIGSAATNWIMTRASDYNTAAQVVQYGVVLSNQGTVNAGLLWQETGVGPWTIGTTAIIFSAYLAQPGSYWLAAPTTPLTAAINTGYYITDTSTVTITLPAIAAAGSFVSIAGTGAGGWVLQPSSGQTIQALTQTASASITSAERYDCISVLCTVANTTWVAISMVTSGFTIS